MRRTVSHSGWSGARAWVYPAACYQCDRPIPDGIAVFCPACTDAWAGPPSAVCPRCGSTVGDHSDAPDGCPRCAGDRFRFEGVFRLGEYRDELRAAVLRMKSPNQEAFAHRFAEWWAGRMRDRLAAIGCDLAVPVPVHWLRRWSRGFNQSLFLARALSAELKCPMLPCLQRVARGEDQKGLSGPERRKNLRRAFRIKRGTGLKGKRILLVDDVLTSGATADACAGVLIDGGAARVAVSAVAKG